MKSRTKSAVAKDRREKAKTGGGPQADTGLDSRQSAISSMLPQQIALAATNSMIMRFYMAI